MRKPGKNTPSLEEYLVDEDVGKAYMVWSKPENYLEEGEFKVKGKTFTYRFRCPACLREFFFNGERTQVLGKVVGHAWEHICSVRAKKF